jgi:predicted Zn-ribbon and HTH transcriptional regulator
MTSATIQQAIVSEYDRARVYKRTDRTLEAEAFVRAAHRLALAHEHCRRCGYEADAHDFDMACPTCDDDAVYFRENN